MNLHLSQDLKVYVRKDFSSESPYYLETVRRILLPHLEPEMLLKGGLKIQTAMDLIQQKHAQKALKKGLEELDKRQGFRGVKENLTDSEKIQTFTRKRDEEPEVSD